MNWIKRFRYPSSSKNILELCITCGKTYILNSVIEATAVSLRFLFYALKIDYTEVCVYVHIQRIQAHELTNGSCGSWLPFRVLSPLKSSGKK